VGAITDGGGSSVALIANQRQALSLKLLAGTELDFPVWVSSVLEDGTVVAIDPGVFVSAIDPTPDFNVGRDTTIHMSDTPTHVGVATGGTPATATAAPTISVFQNGLIAMRLILRLSFGLRAPAVAVVNEATW
jgi:hypothetical protein